MNWNLGYTATYRLTLVDSATWRDIDTLDIVDGSISRTLSDLMESADVTMTELPLNGEAWVRIWLDTMQNGAYEHTALFTGLTSAPERTLDGKRESWSVECYSVLKPAADVLLERGWYAPSDTNGAMLAARLLGVGSAPVKYADDSPTLTSAIIAEDGETNLTMARKIVNAIGWKIRLNGQGEISIEPSTDDSVATLDALENDSIELEITDTNDWYSCPNVLRCTSGDLTATARDDDEDSRLSTTSRGREIWAEETDVSLASNESLASYAIRRLKELQAPSRTVSYSRRYNPEIYPGDVITLHYPGVDIEGLFRVESQSITLGYNAQVSEEVSKI